MHLLVTLQIIQPPAVYETLSIARLLSIIYLVTTEHLIFARLLGKQCYLIVLIGSSLIISDIGHFLGYIH